MSCRLPDDCLNEVFECLEDDKFTLFSCLLVSRAWCNLAVKILWRDIWDSTSLFRRFKAASAAFNTLITCLPDGSKEFLSNILTPVTITIKPPIFNYASFCQVLSICEICRVIDIVLKNKPLDKNCLIAEEVIKMFINQSSSLKKLTFYSSDINVSNNMSFTYFYRKDRLTNLSELCCSSDHSENFFCKLSQICHNLQSITISFKKEVSNGLKQLIFLQNNLKNLKLLSYCDENDWTNIIPALTKHSNTLVNLHLYGGKENLPLFFISSFINLQNVTFSFFQQIYFKDFKKLQYNDFPKLQILKFFHQCPKPEYLIKFLENNGKDLLEFYINEYIIGLNLFISKFCQNLKKLFIIFNYNELNILKIIFNNCQCLESIKIYCGGNRFLKEKEVLETILKYSSKNFYELKIKNYSSSKLSSNDLESFFINWKDRNQNKLFNLIIIKNGYVNNLLNENNMKIIEKYKNLGVIKKFETSFNEEY